MRPTISYLTERFNYYNNLCFDGVLPEVPIRLIDRKGCMGRTVCFADSCSGAKSFLIEISVRFDLPEAEYIDTLVHEMIHYYIQYSGLIDNAMHGSLFQSIMNKIVTTYGIRVTIAYNPGPEEHPVGRIRWHYVCVIGLPDDNVGLCIVAKNKVFDTWHILDAATNIRFFEWYVTCDPFFEAFPTVVSPRPLIVEKGLLYRHLLNASRLKMNGNRIDYQID